MDITSVQYAWQILRVPWPYLDIATTCWLGCSLTICQCYNVSDTCVVHNCALMFLVSGFSRCCQRRWRSSWTNKKTSVFNFWSYIRLPLCIPLRVGAENGYVVRDYGHTPFEKPLERVKRSFHWVHLNRLGTPRQAVGAFIFEYECDVSSKSPWENSTLYDKKYCRRFAWKKYPVRLTDPSSSSVLMYGNLPLYRKPPRLKQHCFAGRGSRKVD